MIEVDGLPVIPKNQSWSGGDSVTVRSQNVFSQSFNYGVFLVAIFLLSSKMFELMLFGAIALIYLGYRISLKETKIIISESQIMWYRASWFGVKKIVLALNDVIEFHLTKGTIRSMASFYSSVSFKDKGHRFFSVSDIEVENMAELLLFLEKKQIAIGKKQRCSSTGKVSYNGERKLMARMYILTCIQVSVFPCVFIFGIGIVLSQHTGNLVMFPIVGFSAVLFFYCFYKRARPKWLSLRGSVTQPSS